MFQGAKAQQETSLWADKSSQVTSSKKNIKDLNTPLPKSFDHWSVVGSDEVGNGRCFGPLTVVAAYVDKSQFPLLKELGVRDSKDMKDSEIIRVASDLITFLPHSLLTVMPQKYNAIQPTMTQGKMKAVLHNQALGHILT